MQKVVLVSLISSFMILMSPANSVELLAERSDKELTLTEKAQKINIMITQTEKRIEYLQNKLQTIEDNKKNQE